MLPPRDSGRTAPMHPRRKTAKRSPVAAAQPSASPVVNLEMKGDRLKVFSLQTLLTNKKRKDTRDAARLGDVLIPWFEKTIAKPAEKLGGIADLWNEHVPPSLLQRSRLVGFSKGTLTVALDS